MVTDADIVLDSIGGPGHLDRSLAAIKNGGRLISLLVLPNDEQKQQAAAKNVYTHRLSVVSDGDDIRSIAALLEQGLLHSDVSQVYAFEEITKAHEQVSSGKTQGKVVVKIP